MEHKVEEVKLKCGAKGLLIDVPDAPVFCMEIWFRAGDSTVKEYSKYEAAHIMEHLAFGANAQHASSADVDRYIKKYGANSNAWTGTDYLAYVRECPDFDWERILKQLVVQITTPKFLEKEFKAEFGNVEEEMRLRSNNKWDEIWQVMQPKFGWEYEEKWLDRLKMMQSVTNKDIREHYKRTHGADNLIFFIAGDLTGKKERITSVLEGLNSLPKTGKFKLYEHPEIKPYKAPVVIPKEDVDNVYLTLKAFGVLDDYEQYQVITNFGVLNKILTDGDHSRIYGKARKRGLVYSLGCSRYASEKGNYNWSLSCQVGNKNIDELLDLIVNEIKKIIKDGVSKEDIAEAVTSLKGSLRMDNQTAGSIMHWNSSWYTSHEEERVYDFDNVDKWYDEVTPESIQKLFLNLIKTKKWGAGFLGNVTETQAKKWNKKLSEIFED